MKIVFALLLFTGASVVTPAQSEFNKQSEAVNPPFKLDITANLEKGHSTIWDFENSARTVVKAGSTIVVAIRKTNISDHEINRRAMAGQTIDVLDGNGSPVAHKKRDALQGSVVHAMRAGTKEMVLQPGETSMDSGRLSEGFELSQPGTYSIQFSEHVSDDSASDVVKSNIITVTVLPAESNPPEENKLPEENQPSENEPNSQTSQQPFVINIHANEPRVYAGDPVYINLTMSNFSDHKIDCTAKDILTIDMNYRYEVLDEDGNAAPKIARKAPSETLPCTLQPMNSRYFGALLSQLYDFSSPGKYLIQVSRPVWGDEQRPGTGRTVQDNQAIVNSNKITITVLPAESKPRAEDARPEAAEPK